MPTANLPFYILPPGKTVSITASPGAYLISDRWDDFGYETMFHLTVVDQHRRHLEIGYLKIGYPMMAPGLVRVELPDSFAALEPKFFSLGQDDSYYQALARLGSELRNVILVGLRDMVYDPAIWKLALEEEVTRKSLLRSVSFKTVLGQFHRILEGGARLTSFAFTFGFSGEENAQDVTELRFEIVPESSPPTNIHVLIGSNGVGKTRMLYRMACVLTDLVAATDAPAPYFVSDNGDIPFTSLVSVTFSAFDPFDPLPEKEPETNGMKYFYIGLKRRTAAGRRSDAPKNPDMLAQDFIKSLDICLKGPKAARWRRAIAVLETDPVFRDANLARLATATEKKFFGREARRLFSSLSAGHKVVLLTLTRLVETVEEKTLVLIDEPEAHLHPPLLAAFIRAVSALLVNRNGVAVVATHSPVVLQEVPKHCVWKLRRSGSVFKAERPESETFGENVGVLTREVFGLEVTQSGFHTLLLSAVAASETYEDLVQRFDGKLGAEARAIARALMALRNRS